MNQGIGSMIHQLSGGSPRNASDFYGKEIKEAVFNEDEIFLTFKDGVKVRIWDDGQSCCERRYMTTDDKIEDLVGKELKSIEVKEADSTEDEYGEPHEIAFLEIKTNDGSVVVETHNEHNGYYGGFGLSIDEVKEN